MAWIEGTEEQTFVVSATPEETLDYFGHPAEFKQCLGDLESSEELDEGRWRWILEEMSEKGITYQAKYTVEYTIDESKQKVTWETVGDDNTMKSEGSAEIRDTDDGTEVHYIEKISADLPIPGLMAKVFNPIVSKEVTKGVGDFLDCSRKHLDSL